MRLAFDAYGDIKSSENKIEDVTVSQAELGRFIFYASVKKGLYDYDVLFGNRVYQIIGKTNTLENITRLKTILEKDIDSSSLFDDISPEISVRALTRNKIGVHLQGKGMNATWELQASAGRGISLVNYNEGSTFADSEPVITKKVFKDFDINKLNFDITSAYFDCMEKNNITSLGGSDFNLRILFLADSTTEPRFINNFEYILSEGLESREVQFHRAFSSPGTLTFQVWPMISQVHQTDNVYLMRKKRTSNPTTIANSY